MSKANTPNSGRPESATPESTSPPPHDKKTAFIAVSPQGWHLKSSLEYEESPLLDRLGLSKADLEKRAYRNTFEWRAIRGSKFLLQSQNHQFAPKYDHTRER